MIKELILLITFFIIPALLVAADLDDDSRRRASMRMQLSRSAPSSPPSMRIEQENRDQDFFLTKEQLSFIKQSRKLAFFGHSSYQKQRGENEKYAQEIMKTNINTLEIYSSNPSAEGDQCLIEFAAAFEQLETKRSFDRIHFSGHIYELDNLVNFVQAIKNNIKVRQLVIEVPYGHNVRADETFKYSEIVANLAAMWKNDNIKHIKIKIPFDKGGWQALGASVASMNPLLELREIEIQNDLKHSEGVHDFIALVSFKSNSNLNINCKYFECKINAEPKFFEFKIIKGEIKKKK